VTDAASHVDLHSHSTASDGAFAPEVVVDYAHKAGLSAIALTDHDTLAGVAAAREHGERLGVRVIAGVELSVLDGEREVHVLGLHVARVEALEAELAAIRETRRSRAVAIVGKLNALGVPITADLVWTQAGGGAVGRPHIAKALIAGGWVRDQREAFDRYLGAGRPANVDKHRLSAADGIRLIHEAGGIAVFAHPGADGRRERIEPLIAAGLDGIEVRHPSHGAEDTSRLMALTTFFGLVPSGGSDWHGATAGPRVLGALRVPAEWLDRQDALVAARAAAVV
jgi:predicted metal-dependent phosphoesterase TrpH